MMIIGCDLHMRYQQIAMVDTDTGGWPVLSRSEGRVQARRRTVGWIPNFSRLLAVQCDSISTTPSSAVR